MSIASARGAATGEVTGRNGVVATSENTRPGSPLVGKFGGINDGLAGAPNAVGEQASVIGRIGQPWMKVLLECDDRYRQFLTVKKPAVASQFQTSVQ